MAVELLKECFFVCFFYLPPFFLLLAWNIDMMTRTPEGTYNLEMKSHTLNLARQEDTKTKGKKEPRNIINKQLNISLNMHSTSYQGF